MSTVILLTISGLIGIFLRYFLDCWTAIPNGQFNWTTFSINLAGSFLAGAIYVLAQKLSWSPAVQTALLVGLCGGFTTFSAYSLQTFLMLENGRTLGAVTYLILSPLAGLLAVALAVTICRQIIG